MTRVWFRGTPAKCLLAITSVAVLAFAAAACGSDQSSAQDTTTTGAGYTPLTSAPAETTGRSTTGPGDGSGTATTSAPGGVTTGTAGGTNPTTAPGADALLPPTGTFLSSHRLSLSGAGAPGNARSVCRTSPGAKCWLTFSKDGKNVSFLARTVGDDGVASWDWSPADIHLTAGHWDVTVTAERGSEQQVVDEAIGLDVVA
jgi:hypothetical protein